MTDVWPFQAAFIRSLRLEDRPTAARTVSLNGSQLTFSQWLRFQRAASAMPQCNVVERG